MSEGYSANQVTVIENVYLDNQFPGELKLYLEAVDGFGAEVAFSIEHDTWSELELVIGARETQGIQCLYANLQRVFEAKHPGLKLVFAFHDPRTQGDQYDEIGGNFFHVENAYELVPSAKPIEAFLRVAMYVTQG